MKFHDDGYVKKASENQGYDGGEFEYLPETELELFPPAGYDMYVLPADAASQSYKESLEEVLHRDDLRVRSLDRIP